MLVSWVSLPTKQLHQEIMQINEINKRLTSIDSAWLYAAEVDLDAEQERSDDANFRSPHKKNGIGVPKKKAPAAASLQFDAEIQAYEINKVLKRKEQQQHQQHDMNERKKRIYLLENMRLATLLRDKHHRKKYAPA